MHGTTTVLRAKVSDETTAAAKDVGIKDSLLVRLSVAGRENDSLH